MNTFKKICLGNEVRIDSFRGSTRTPPYYYDSLRHAFSYYFNTFITNNASYQWYAEGLAGRDVRILKKQFLDEDNTVLTLISFERFFELFLKNALQRVHRKLVYATRERGLNTQTVLDRIQTNTFQPSEDRDTGKPQSIPFRQTINRYYSLLDFTKQSSPNPSNVYVIKFKRIANKYSFLDSSFHRESLEVLNWYRDRILHNGNKFPSPWLLDYLVTQRFLPIVNEILAVEQLNLGESLFYLETLTGIKLLKDLTEIKFEFSDLKKKRKTSDVFYKLLKIGHLKELGRANMNMNLFVRQNRATYEYNYHDVKGRGRRFAQAEDGKHPDFKGIKNCPCCSERSLVVYQSRFKDFDNRNIEWVKCYTCDFHIRYNVGDLILFQLSSEKVFQE